MPKHFHTIVIGGGCLGVAAAVSLARRLIGNGREPVCLIEKAVLGAGLSSRHSAIIRSANASATAARLAARSTDLWKDLADLWGVAVPWERPGAIWIGQGSTNVGATNPWHDLASSMRQNGVDFHAIDRAEASRLTERQLRLDADEIYFFEPEVLQLEASGVLQAMQKAVKAHAVELKEHTRVEGFDLNGKGLIRGVRTNHGEVGCDFVVNAAGGWSSSLFAPLGVQVPVALEPVYAANWLISSADLPENLPIIADYVNRAYFRRWRGSILHMHQPRQRKPQSIAADFAHSLMNPAGADIIYDASNYAVTHQQVAHYGEKVRNRFPSIGSPIYAGGYVSYFDITPDLKFILGPDGALPNLIHCLGAGQALKYAPIFGELMRELILEGRTKEFDLSEFSIQRFATKPLDKFWKSENQQVAENTL